MCMNVNYFSFNGKIKTNNDYSYSIYKDKEGLTEIPTNTILLSIKIFVTSIDEIILSLNLILIILGETFFKFSAPNSADNRLKALFASFSSLKKKASRYQEAFVLAVLRINFPTCLSHSGASR